MEGDTGGSAHPTEATARHRRGRRIAATLGATALVLPLAACAADEPSSEPPDPGAPITRSPH